MFINMPYDKIMLAGQQQKVENTILGWQESLGVKRLAVQPESLHSIPGTQVVEEEKQPLHVVL